MIIAGIDYSQYKREQRPPFTFKSGAVYNGEWRGNARDGYGEQVWPDGAKYLGINCCINDSKIY